MFPMCYGTSDLYVSHVLHVGQVTCVALKKFSYYKSKYIGPFLRLPLSSVFCFIVALGPSTLSTIAESRYAVARDVDYPVLIPSRTNAWHARSRL